MIARLKGGGLWILDVPQLPARHWTIAAGVHVPREGLPPALLPVCVQTALSELHRVALAGHMLGLLEGGVEGGFVEVIEWQGATIVRRNLRVWRAGAWQGGPWQTERPS